MLLRKQLSKHQLQNFLQSFLLLGAMGLLLGGLGWILFGGIGALMSVVLGLVGLFLIPQFSPRLSLQFYQAQQLSPSEAPNLYALVRELTHRAELPSMPQLYYIPSQMINAFAVGHREEAAIAITDGLVRTLNLQEVAGVLAHEVAHIKNNDIWIMGLADGVSRLTRLMSILGQLLLLINLPFWFIGGQGIPWLLVVILLLTPFISALLQLALSRTREFDADVDAAELTGDPLGLASALQKIHQTSHFWQRILRPGHHAPEPSLLRTHPQLEERIKRLRSLVKEEPREFFQQLPPLVFHQNRPSVLTRPRYRWHGLWY